MFFRATSFLRLAPAVLSIAVVGGCSNQAFRDGMAALGDGRRDEGIAHLEQAAREKPRDAEIKAALINNRMAAVRDALAEAEAQLSRGRLAEAEAGYRRVLGVDGRNARALQGIEQIAIERRHLSLLEQAGQMLVKNDLLGAERLVRTVRAQSPVMARRCACRRPSINGGPTRRSG